ncbi:MAG TPA: adenylate kinase [Candidatus Kapabacteria bacterium]|jgi:adenylate kinase family enzyme|nr:adenylate kinase [Ignavibacteria bacterium]HRE58423.1 adenylate kinase [Candidatus Kapabacteria bacterium]HRI29884.1 adenylate kinase [Candidatus Kapabacteria bacterium]HRK58006.1 adenylate kinase [Candidatus Kapabacteria bacterium]
MDKVHHIKIVVVGTSGSGKTTLAMKIKAALRIPHIHLDSLYWLPNWRERSVEEFRRITKEALSATDSWVCDGNYSAVRDLIWREATHIIWLNYSPGLVFWRGLKRTCRRVFLKEEFIHGNYESFTHAFLSRNSILWWILTTYKVRRKRYPLLLEAEQKKRNVHVVIVHNPHELEKFLENFFARRES